MSEIFTPHCPWCDHSLNIGETVSYGGVTMHVECHEQMNIEMDDQERDEYALGKCPACEHIVKRGDSFIAFLEQNEYWHRQCRTKFETQFPDDCYPDTVWQTFRYALRRPIRNRKLIGDMIRHFANCFLNLIFPKQD